MSQIPAKNPGHKERRPPHLPLRLLRDGAFAVVDGDH